MPQVGNSSLGTIEFSLAWNSADAQHVERLHAHKVNFWRDTFPGTLRAALEGAGVGRKASQNLPPWASVPAHSAAQVLAIPRCGLSGLAFAARRLTGCDLTLRPGRFHPRGRIHGLPGVFDVDDLRPALLLGLDDANARLDLNHPLSGRELSASAEVLDVRPKPGDTGGVAHDWLEELCAGGPGMQAPQGVDAPDFGLGNGGLARLDESPDAEFYAQPRQVDHLDALALQGLADMYAARLAPGMRVLDLMASRDSHLPEELELDLTGLGLNAEELAANPRLAGHPFRRFVQDLNASPHLPFAEASFDAVLLSLSVEYLTNPAAVLAEAARVLVPGGRLLVSFSDRWFPTKAVRLWTELHPFERLGYVLALLRGAGAFTGLGTETLRGRPRPWDDAHAHELRDSDPLFLAEATRRT
jgi:SAM-dependent methyltransferase